MLLMRYFIISTPMVASVPGSPSARGGEEEERAWYQLCMHAQVLPRFWVNHILSVHPPSPKRDVVVNNYAKSAVE